MSLEEVSRQFALDKERHLLTHRKETDKDEGMSIGCCDTCVVYENMGNVIEYLLEEKYGTRN